MAIDVCAKQKSELEKSLKKQEELIIKLSKHESKNITLQHSLDGCEKTKKELKAAKENILAKNKKLRK